MALACVGRPTAPRHRERRRARAPRRPAGKFSTATLLSMQRLLVIAAFLALAAASAPAAAQACSCAGPGKGERRDFYSAALKRADAAIIGKVVDRRVMPGGGQAVVVYRVRRAFKKQGRFPAGREVAVRTSAYGASCGIEQRIGSVGGILLDRFRKHWSGSLCSQVPKRALRRAARDHHGNGGSGANAGGCPAGQS